MFPLKETYAPSSQLTWILITKGCLEPPLFSVFKVLMNLHHFVIRSYQLHVCALLNMKKISLIKPSNQSIGMFIRWLHTLQWDQNQWKCVKSLLEILESKEVTADKAWSMKAVVSQNFMYGALNLGASVEHHLDLPCQLVNARRGDYSWLTNGVCVGGSGGRLVHRLVVHCLMSCLRLLSIYGDAG